MSGGATFGPTFGSAARAGGRRAWLLLLCVLLAVGVYLSVWTAYAIHGLTDYGRFVQLAPGAEASAMGARFRVTSLVQTYRLTNSVTEESVGAVANAVWLVARIDVVRDREDPDLFCSFKVLGPDRRVWDPDSSYVSREAENGCTEPEQLTLGRTYSLEVIFQIPERYVGDLAGIVVDDPVSRAARPVLVPPA